MKVEVALQTVYAGSAYCAEVSPTGTEMRLELDTDLVVSLVRSSELSNQSDQY